MTPLLSSTLSGIDGVAHGFFGRQGGVSTGIYASLNCGYGSSDETASVTENRTRVARALGAEGDRLLTVHQIHSPEAVHVTVPWSRGDAPKADAMATIVPGIALGVLAADCAPVLLADPQARVIGAAHAGWKGALGGVVESVVALMETLGAKRSRIRAAVGPCISQAAYEVGPEFRARLLEQRPDNAGYLVPSKRADHWQFDLPGYVAAKAEALELAGFDRLDTCTYANSEQYFSFRRTTHRSEPDYGRNLSAIMLTP
jgi:purine-nucleoside/S-methyl-5'-thioadenosine phosphorylase / adenosine deaminase